jgi:hypothetical protein
MTEDEAFEAIHAFLCAINQERKFIDALYKPLVAINRAYQTAPVPKGPYGLITFLGTTDSGEADYRSYGEAVVLERSRQASDPAMQSVAVATETRTKSELHRYRFDFYASRPSDYARLFQAAFRSERALSDLGGLLPRSIHDISYEPELVGQQWEGRARFEVELAALRVDLVAIDTIEKGSISSEGVGASRVETEFSFQKGT